MNRHGGNVTTDGIRLSSPVDLDGGKCSVSIGAVTKDHFGAWTCVLVAAADGEVLTGDVELRDGKEYNVCASRFDSWAIALSGDACVS